MANLWRSLHCRGKGGQKCCLSMIGRDAADFAEESGERIRIVRNNLQISRKQHRDDKAALFFNLSRARSSNALGGPTELAALEFNVSLSGPTEEANS